MSAVRDCQIRAVTAGDDGVAYEVTGSGPCVVCIQGVGVAGRGWRPQVDALARRFRVITIDNRGTGHSRRGPLPLTIESMAADVAAVLDSERVDRAHVVGHSMGGLIALHVAVTMRARVKSLALLCTFAAGRDATAFSPRMALLGLAARIGTRRMRRNGMMRMIMPSAYVRGADRRRLADELGDLFGRDLADQPPIVSEQLRAMSSYSASSRLAELGGLPTIVVSARHDPIAPPRLGRSLADGIPGATFVEFDAASHALPIQYAHEVNDLLLAHLTGAELGTRRPGARLQRSPVVP